MVTTTARFFHTAGRALALLGILAMLAMSVRAALLLAGHSLQAIQFPYALDYGEGPLLDQSVRLARGEGLYRLDVPPYTIDNYPPVFALMQAPWVAGFGASYAYGRILSLVSALAAALFLALTAHALTRSRAAAAVSAGLLLATPYLFHWSALARIDTLALALSLGGLLVAVRWPGSTRAALAAALLLALAAFTRQTYLLAAPLAAFTWRWGAAGAGAAWKFAVLLGSIVLGAFALLLAATQGGLWFHLIVANVNLLHSAQIEAYAAEVLRAFPIVLLMAAALLLLGWTRRAARRAWWLAAPYLLGGLAVALTIAKIGSNVNYLYELCAALALAGGVCVGLLARLPGLQAVALAALAVQIGMLQSLSEDKYAAIVRERIARQEELAALFTLVRDEARPIVADEAMGMLPLAGKPILFQPFEMSQIALGDVWDQREWLDALRDGRYPVVLIDNPYRNPSLRYERWTPEMLAVINDRFRLATQRAETSVYWYDAGG
jgi:hypothetical protein